MKSIDVIAMMKTVASVVPLEGDNKFLVRWGSNRETVIAIQEAAQPGAQQTGLEVLPHKHDFKNSLYCSVCGVAEF